MFPANRSSHSFARIQRIALLALLLGTVGLFTVGGCAAQEQVPSTGQTISVDQVRPGIFTKEPIAGVTPIADVLAGGGTAGPISGGASPGNAMPGAVSNEFASRAGVQSGAELRSIETPLVFSGFQPSAIQKFSSQ